MFCYSESSSSTISISKPIIFSFNATETPLFIHEIIMSQGWCIMLVQGMDQHVSISKDTKTVKNVANEKEITLKKKINVCSFPPRNKIPHIYIFFVFWGGGLH